MRKGIMTTASAILITAAVLAACPRRALCSDGPGRAAWLAGMTWDVGIPAGDTRDFLTEPSYLGLGVSFGRSVPSPSARLYTGITWQWNPFLEDSRESLSVPDFDVTGDHSRRIWLSPFLAEMGYDYTWKAGPRRAKFFWRLGAGVYYIRKKVEAGITGYEETDWQVGVSPEAGLRVPLLFGLEAGVSARYHFILDTGVLDDQAYLTFRFGMYRLMF